MWVFIWKATEHSNSMSDVYSNFQDAWNNFKELTVVNFPDIIMEMNQAGDGMYYGSEMKLDDMLKKGFALPEDTSISKE